MKKYVLITQEKLDRLTKNQENAVSQISQGNKNENGTSSAHDLVVDPDTKHIKGEESSSTESDAVSAIKQATPTPHLSSQESTDNILERWIVI